MRRSLILAAFGLTLLAAHGPAHADGHAMQFFGSGVGGIDRVKVPLVDDQGAATPINVGGDFTLECWLKCNLEDNAGRVAAEADGWITGNIIFDRDVYYAGDYGDWGISLGDGRLAFGLAVGSSGATIVGRTVIADGQWHHVAVTREGSSGNMCIYIDGKLDAQGRGPAGDASYRAGRPTQWPNSDPYLVIGAEKHDAGRDQWPSYHGLLDEVRLSNVIRYAQDFDPPRQPFSADDHTVLLLHLDEGEGNVATNAVAAGPNGAIHRGGDPVGPVWVSDTPFGCGDHSQPSSPP